MKPDNFNAKDIEICKQKIKMILLEYNCDLESADESWVLIRDNDTDETINATS